MFGEVVLIDIREIRTKAGGSFRVARFGNPESYTNFEVMVPDSFDIPDGVRVGDLVDIEVHLETRVYRLTGVLKALKKVE